MNDAFGQPQSVLVMGGGSDIGRAIVRALVSRRARTVILAGRSDSDATSDAAAELGANSEVTVHGIDFDASQPETHVQVIDEAWSKFGDIDCVIIAFGVLGDQTLIEADPSQAIGVITTNTTAAMTVGLAVAAKLRAQGHGTLVALSSVAAERPRRANFVYAASKAGMDAFYRGLDDALYGTGARVLIVRPGFVRTKMTAGLSAPPFATDAPAVAEVVVEALGRRATVVWAPKLLRPLALVMRVLPRALWRRVGR